MVAISLERRDRCLRAAAEAPDPAMRATFLSHAKLCEKDAALINASMVALADSAALLRQVWRLDRRPVRV
jgi:hypothetical protein